MRVVTGQLVVTASWLCLPQAQGKSERGGLAGKLASVWCLEYVWVSVCTFLSSVQVGLSGIGVG